MGTVLEIEFPNKLKTDLETQCKMAASAALALSKAIGDAKRMIASLKVKAASEPLYQPKVEQVQKCSNLLDERVNVVMDVLASAKASSEGDEDQLTAALAQFTNLCTWTRGGRCRSK